jgi:hypothetical protein
MKELRVEILEMKSVTLRVASRLRRRVRAGMTFLRALVRRGVFRRDAEKGTRDAVRSPGRASPRGFLFELLRAKHRPRRMPLRLSSRSPRISGVPVARLKGVLKGQYR